MSYSNANWKMYNDLCIIRSSLKSYFFIIIESISQEMGVGTRSFSLRRSLG